MATVSPMISNMWFLPVASAFFMSLSLADPQQNRDSVNEKNTPTDCKCDPYYLCNNKILDNGMELIDILSSFPGSHADFNRTRRLCEAAGCYKPPEVQKPEDQITPPSTIHKKCGQHNPKGVGVRIIGLKDNQAQFGEFPWMVAVFRKGFDGKGKKRNVYQCGGALIHRQAVLTAYHCVNRKAASSLKIRVGEWDTKIQKKIYPNQDRDVEDVVLHEGFDSRFLFNDFAILILKTPVDLTENVNVICLPNQSTQFNDSHCFVSGWGKDVFGQAGKYQSILKKLKLQIVPRNLCQNYLRSTRLGKYFTLHDSFICAGGQTGEDACEGDGGSPLVCALRNDPTRYVQVGIVAWGIGCGENLVPGVYANVAGARQWIDDQIDHYNLNQTIYEYRR